MRYRKCSGLRQTRDAMPGCTYQRGFTLLEVLIAVVILSVGLLGLAALQATSLEHNKNSMIRSQIAILGYDMIDRMRANAPAVTAGNYNLLDDSVLPAGTDATCTSVTGCTPAAMALQDYFEWDRAIQAALPGCRGAGGGTACGVVCIDSTPNDGADSATPGCDGDISAGTEFVVKMWFDENRDGSLDEDLDGTLNDPFVMSFRL